MPVYLPVYRVLLSLMIVVGISLSGCGSGNQTVTPVSAETSSGASVGAEAFAGSYAGTWSFTALSASSPTNGGTVVLTIDSTGKATAVFTDTIGTGSFQASGTVDSSGNITYTAPTANGGILVGAPSFSGKVAKNAASQYVAAGTVSYDYPGSGSFSATE